MGTLMSQKHWDLTSEGKDVEGGDSGPSLVSGVEVTLVFTRGCQPLLCNPCGKQRRKIRFTLDPQPFQECQDLCVRPRLRKGICQDRRLGSQGGDQSDSLLMPAARASARHVGSVLPEGLCSVISGI